MRILAFLSACLFLLSCSKTTYTLKTLPDTYIEWGSYGGFTGQKHGYYILPNGQRFEEYSSGSQGEELSALPRKEAKKLFKSFAKSDIKSIDYRKSGNLTEYIFYYEKGQIYTLTWPSGEMPAEIAKLHALLLIGFQENEAE